MYISDDDNYVTGSNIAQNIRYNLHYLISIAWLWHSYWFIWIVLCYSNYHYYTKIIIVRPSITEGQQKRFDLETQETVYPGHQALEARTRQSL